MSFATTFNDFVVISIIFGLGEAQVSGTLQSWLDTAYKGVDSSVDPDRKNYGYSMSKIEALGSLVSGITFIIGGLLATIYSREFAFRFQSATVLFTAFFVIKLLSTPRENSNPTPASQDNNVTERNDTSFLSFLKGGIEFLLSSKRAFFFLVGLSVFQVVWSIWGALLLFPFYFGYTGDDSSTGMMRSAIFFVGVYIQIKLSHFTKKVEKDKLIYFILFQGVVLFVGGIMLMRFIPMNNSLNLVGIGFTFLLMGIAVSLTAIFINTIIQREMVDLVPSENRNAVYSLIPTIRSAIAIPLLPFVGALVENSGLEAGFLILLGITFIVILFIWLAINIAD
ncbi:MAG: MFS transporter, partial [Candidatus Heimdallarchaeota archaeon]